MPGKLGEISPLAQFANGIEAIVVSFDGIGCSFGLAAGYKGLWCRSHSAFEIEYLDVRCIKAALGQIPLRRQ